MKDYLKWSFDYILTNLQFKMTLKVTKVFYFNYVMDGPKRRTNQWTDQQTDRPTYQVSESHAHD